MSDIEVYDQPASQYDELQNARPDYVGAEKAFIELAQSHLSGMKEISVADFCCGTGKHTRDLSEKFHIRKATLIDINRDFLDSVNIPNINENIDLVCGDILSARLRSENDVVISMFAYHHVPDSDKGKFLDQAVKALKKGGILILGEIYSPGRDITIRYYDLLFESVPKDRQTSVLKNFLSQTALSDDFEYKVSKEFAERQLKEHGFELLESRRIWPTSIQLGDDVGTYVEVWKLSV